MPTIRSSSENLFNGTKLNERFRSAETVERVRLEQKDFSFLYEQGNSLVFMDTESYEQLGAASLARSSARSFEILEGAYRGHHCTRREEADPIVARHSRATRDTIWRGKQAQIPFVAR